jgi:hypothetical protein
MSENLHNIDDLFRKALDGHEEEPSANVWENIDRNLDKKRFAFISNKYRKLKWVAAALLIFSAGMAMYTIHTRIKNKELARLNEANKKKMTDRQQVPFENKVRDTISGDVAVKDGSKALPSSSLAVDKNGKGLATKGAHENAGNKNATEGIDAIRRDNTTANNPRNNAGTTIAQNETTTENRVKQRRLKTVLRSTSKVKTNTQHDIAVSSKTAKQTEAEDKPPYKDVEVSMQSKPDFLHVESENAGIRNALRALAANKAILDNSANTLIKKPKRKLPFTQHLSVGVFYSPDIVSAMVSNDKRGFRDEDRDQIKRQEKITKAFSAGVKLGYNIAGEWGIETGIAYSGFQTSIRPKFLYAHADARGDVNYRFNSSAGYCYLDVNRGNRPPVPGDSIMAVSSKNSIRYITVPLAVTYTVTVGRFSLIPSLGFAANFSSKAKLQTTVATQNGYENAGIDHIEGLNSTYWTGSAALGAAYNLSNTIALIFTPVARFGFTSINKNSPVKTYLNSMGFGGGLTMKF